MSLTIDVPAGDFASAPGDIVVLRTNGDLEYWPNGLAPSPSNRADPILLADRPDPRVVTDDGPGPNVVTDVAGIANGSFVYTACCEPVSGNVYAAGAPASEVGPIAVGSLTDLSPSGTRLATANEMQVGVFDLDTGDGRALLLNQDPEQEYRSIVDIEWIDDETLATITRIVGEHHLVLYDAGTLATSRSKLNFDTVVVHDSVRVTGMTPDGYLTVAVTEGTRLAVLYLNPSNLQEDLDRQQNFPLSVTNLETDDDGLGQIWVDGRTLYHLPPGSFSADALASDVRAAWFGDP